MNKRNKLSMQYTQLFINKYIHCKNINALSDLKEKDYDAIVVGSDQVWRPPYYSQIEGAFLNFSKGWNIRRIAYAPSFGVDNWEYTDEQTEECRRLLRCFDAVSVREESGVTLCRKYLGRDAEWVLDPTMLLDAKDYAKLFQLAGTLPSKGNLLCYILDESPRTKTLIDNVAESLNLKAFRVNSQVEDYNASLECCIQPPVESWIRGFHDAQFVVTDSFHACVFSILFRKQFVVAGNAGRGLSRIKSLLGMLGLESRHVDERTDFRGLGNIDYNKVHDRLKTRKEQSKAFLLNSLGGDLL